MAQKLISSDLCQRILKEGASKLSNSELVAILLETMPLSKKMTTLKMSRKLLKYDDELHLFEGGVHDWIWYLSNSKKNKKAFLKASLEVQKRGLTEVFKNYNAGLYPDLLCHFLKLEYREGAGSMVSGLFVNEQHRMLGFEDLFLGLIDGTNICHQTIFEEIVRHAKRYSAAKVIMVHKQLSLDASPTLADISFLLWLRQELRVTGMLLLDSWIIGENSSIYLAEQGLF
jgi:DNA repair protein RadC